MNIEILQVWCENLDHKTMTVRDGMDAMMPRMAGFEATEKLKSNDATKHIPTIMVTSKNSWL